MSSSVVPSAPSRKTILVELIARTGNASAIVGFG
jgi:hypothetical protein